MTGLEGIKARLESVEQMVSNSISSLYEKVHTAQSKASEALTSIETHKVHCREDKNRIEKTVTENGDKLDELTKDTNDQVRELTKLVYQKCEVINNKFTSIVVMFLVTIVSAVVSYVLK